MNEAKIIGICKRTQATPLGRRGSLLAELVQAIDEDKPERGIGMLRDALTWPEVRGNARAVASICPSLRSLRGNLELED